MENYPKIIPFTPSYPELSVYQAQQSQQEASDHGQSQRKQCMTGLVVSAGSKTGALIYPLC